MRSVPRLTVEGLKLPRLDTIEGNVPNLLALPAGCSFAPRCDYAIPECSAAEIPLIAVDDEQFSRCIRFDRVGVE